MKSSILDCDPRSSLFILFKKAWRKVVTHSCVVLSMLAMLDLNAKPQCYWPSLLSGPFANSSILQSSLPITWLAVASKRVRMWTAVSALYVSSLGAVVCNTGCVFPKITF